MLRPETFRRLKTSHFTSPLTLLLLVSLQVFLTQSLPEQENPERSFPKNAVRFLNSHSLGERMGNPFGWGGYLLYHLSPRYKVLYDGRCEMYLKNHVLETLTDPTLTPRALLEKIERYSPDFLLLDFFENRPLGKILSEDERYALVFWDEKSAIFLRKTRATQPQREQLAYRTINPFAASPFYFSKEKKLAAIHEIKRALRDSPANYFAHNQLGLMAHEAGQLEQAKARYATVLYFSPRFVQAHYNLARLALLEGDREAARFYLQQGIAINPNFFTHAQCRTTDAAR